MRKFSTYIYESAFNAEGKEATWVNAGMTDRRSSQTSR